MNKTFMFFLLSISLGVATAQPVATQEQITSARAAYSAATVALEAAKATRLKALAAADASKKVMVDDQGPYNKAMEEKAEVQRLLVDINNAKVALDSKSAELQASRAVLEKSPFNSTAIAAVKNLSPQVDTLKATYDSKVAAAAPSVAKLPAIEARVTSTKATFDASKAKNDAANADYLKADNAQSAAYIKLLDAQAKLKLLGITP